MNLIYRQGKTDDLGNLRKLGIRSWKQFEEKLTPENWLQLYNSLLDETTYSELFEKSHCIICTTGKEQIIGMAFLVPSGNPTDIYDKEWCYIRFVSVDPDFSGQGIGRKLTTMCIDIARQNRENTIALHTSELMEKARHIYESLGFKILKEIDRRLGKQYWLYTLNIKE